ncbi:MAG: hypothetical protein ACREO5_01085 [Candidatus Binatia bacterium]
MVLSLTLSDGNKVQYRVESRRAEISATNTKEAVSQKAFHEWQLSSLGTALSIGNVKLPIGIDVNLPGKTTLPIM